jgi:hypothetical protein
MSVDIEPLMIAAGLAPLHYVPAGQGAVKLKVGDLRDLGFRVGSDPDIPGGNPQHGLVWGIGNGSKRRKRILKIAITVRKVPGED